MRVFVRAIAKAAPVVALGLFALVPAAANAAPSAQSVVVAHMGDAGSAGSGDSHGHNNNQSPQENSNNHAEVHILRPGTRH